MVVFGIMSPKIQAEARTALGAAVLRLLRPLVRILLRYGVPYGAFADLAKASYIDVASSEFSIRGRKQTSSRVSVITGLSRKEVRRVQNLDTARDELSIDRYNRAARVISGWVRDERFQDRAGRPAPLPFDAPGERDFHALAREYSGDVPARAIYDELQRVGAVETLKDGRIRLATRAYVPQGGEVDKLAILGVDVSDLISCIDHNLQCPPEEAFFQRKVSYDNLPNEAGPELRRTAAERAQRLLEELDSWMAARDRDVNPSIGGTGRRRAVLGVYYYEEDAGDGDATGGESESQKK
jgi:Family of unknown function (DUF6502)